MEIFEYLIWCILPLRSLKEGYRNEMGEEEKLVGGMMMMWIGSGLVFPFYFSQKIWIR